MSSTIRTRYTGDMFGVAQRPMKRLTPAADPLPFHLQPRDLEIVRVVHRYGFATTDQVVRHVGGARRGVANRLKLLFDHKILGRPKHQYLLLRAFHSLGNPGLVYTVRTQGVRLLAQHGDAVEVAANWSNRNEQVVPFTLNHEVDVAETMLAFELACRAAEPDIELIDQDRLLRQFPASTRASAKPFACAQTVTLSDRMQPLLLTTLPDRLFSLAYADGTRHNFALERDRGTMSIGSKRTRLIGKASIRKKLLGYWSLWKAGLHEQRWGFQRFRLLTVTTSEKRIANMLQCQREVTNNSAAGLFLYATPQRIAEHGILGPAWVSADGDGLWLLPAATRRNVDPKGEV